MEVQKDGPPTEQNQYGFATEQTQYGFATSSSASAPPAPIQGQPQWMTSPGQVAGCPPGLEYLINLDQLLAHQQVELLEAVTGWETNNKFVLKNSLGQQCYFAFEETDCLMRICCGPNRGYMFHIVDNTGREVMRLNREFKCCVGCCCCISGDTCAFISTVEAPVGTPLGRVVQLFSKWTPRYAIQSVDHETLLVIQGPCCVCSGPCCPADTEFQVLTADETQVIGRVARQFSGFAKEMFTDATNFGINFPRDLDVKVKALLVGAMFLIDMMFFERNN